MNDDELLRRLGEAVAPDVPALDPSRVEAIRTQAESAPVPTASVRPLRSRRSLLRAGAAALGGVAAGAIGAVAVVGRDDDPAGPPLEAITLRASSGIDARADLIAHTWGMELLLDASGLEPDGAYEVTFVATDGRRVGAGGFVGTDGLVRCRNNGPLLRTDAARIIVTGPGSSEAITADLA